MTDEEGRFEFKNILPGKHLQLAYWGKGVPRGRSLAFDETRPGASDAVKIELPEAARIRGTIRRDRFAEAGSIRLSLAGASFQEYESKLAEDQSSFEFDDLPPGEYWISVGSKPVEFTENGAQFFRISPLASQKIQMQPGETKEISFNEPDADQKAPAKPDPAPGAKPAAAARSLDIVIAQHVILWDGRIRTWEEVVTELREIRKAKGEPIHPHFYFTNAAHAAGHFETYKAKLWKVYRELFEPAGMSLGSISPRAGPRYDAIRKPEDLIPDPSTLRSGIVVEKGQPQAGVLVVLVPKEGVLPVVLRPDLTLRDPHDEVWTVTGPDGRFTLPVQPAHADDEQAGPPKYALATISQAGYRLVEVPAKGETATIELLPLARVELTPVEGKPQRIDLRLDGGLPDASSGFSIYEIDLRDKPLNLSLPPGKITVQREFLQEDGGSRGYPAETVRLGPGDSRKITVPNITEEEAKRKWIEDSLRPRRDSKKPDK